VTVVVDHFPPINALDLQPDFAAGWPQTDCPSDYLGAIQLRPQRLYFIQNEVVFLRSDIHPPVVNLSRPSEDGDIATGDCVGQSLRLLVEVPYAGILIEEDDLPPRRPHLVILAQLPSTQPNTVDHHLAGDLTEVFDEGLPECAA
ncbi:uncharacterized protein METZ01_LOCUS74384, partial [marine metagenome]